MTGLLIALSTIGQSLLSACYLHTDLNTFIQQICACILATNDELLLHSALESMESTPMPDTMTPDAMTEEQQIELALKMSLATSDAMETDITPVETKPAVSVCCGKKRMKGHSLCHDYQHQL